MKRGGRGGGRGGGGGKRRGGGGGGGGKRRGGGGEEGRGGRERGGGGGRERGKVVHSNDSCTLMSTIWSCKRLMATFNGFGSFFEASRKPSMAASWPAGRSRYSSAAMEAKASSLHHTTVPGDRKGSIHVCTSNFSLS